MWRFCLLLKKGDLTVIRNFENTIVLKVKIMKKPKVEAASYNRVFGQNFQFKNLKEMSLKNQCVSYNWVRLITEKIWYFILWKSSSNHIYNQYPPLNWQYPPSLGNPQAFDHRLCPRDGKFESCLAGLGDLNLKYKVFPTQFKCCFFTYGGD